MSPELPSQDDPFHAYDLVVIGSSAGGIEALSIVVAGLPTDFGAALVIAQHLDPDRLSHLGEILARHTSLPIHTVETREPLLPGMIYVVPADRDVEITDHTVRLLRDARRHLKPSVNRLFSSAASAHGERLIGVILTGAGSDGALGARDIKAAGGMVVIENPATAAYASMPLSLAPNTVDLVADLAQIGPLLGDLVAGTFAPSPAEVAIALPTLLSQLRHRSGIDFSEYKTPTILRRLQRRLAACGVPSLSEYLVYLANHPEEYQQLLSSFLIKVTEFFRDLPLFDALRDVILPKIIEHARETGTAIRCWSAGCATGEEAYSLAILFAEVLGSDIDQVPVRIFATDLDADAIAFARRGIYPVTALTGMSEARIARSFVPVDGAYEVAAPLRHLVTFGQHDLGQRAPFPHIDLVLCRNVLIYFTPELQRRTLQLFAFALRDGGYLVLGKSETPHLLASAFVEARTAPKIYLRQGARVAVPTSQLRVDPLPPPLLVTGWRPMARPMPLPAVPHLVTTGEKIGNLLMGLPLGVVVVDRHYDIQVINSAAQRLLGIMRVAPGADLIHLVAAPVASPLRAAIDEAFQQTTSQIALSLEAMLGETRHLRVATYPPHQTMPPVPQLEQVLILITDVTEATRAEQRQAAAVQGPLVDALTTQSPELAWEVERQRLIAQIAQLTHTNRTLLEANQELAYTNLALTSSNEEIMVQNEEMQTATEEIKTLNEELQAANEEMETLNEEQEATVEELRMTNEDLQAKSVEVLLLATLRMEQQRISEIKAAELATILLSMGDALLVLDGDGKTRFTNPAYVALFGDEFAVFHAEDDNGNLLAPEFTPQRLALAGQPFQMTFTLMTSTGERRWIETTCEPIVVEGFPTGSVLTFRDISDRNLRRLQDEFVALATHELLGPLTIIKATAQMLARKAPGEELNQVFPNYLEIILRQTVRQQRLINDLMDMERLQDGKLHLQMRQLDLRELVAHIVAAVALSLPNLPLVTELVEEPVLVLGDAVRLEQVLTNLLNNAGRYAASSPRITIRLQRVEDLAELQVVDMGPGIAPELLPHIFQRFYQVPRVDEFMRQGLGLGLYIVWELVQAHQGDIEVQSVVGQGTAFRMHFPLVRDGVIAQHEEQQAQDVS